MNKVYQCSGESSYYLSDVLAAVAAVMGSRRRNQDVYPFLVLFLVEEADKFGLVDWKNAVAVCIQRHRMRPWPFLTRKYAAQREKIR